MNESKRLADQLKRALEGEAWHGPAWNELLEGVTRDQAVARPVPSAHTIAEIVHHTATWQDVVRRRIEGESPQVSDEENFPAEALKDEAAWTALKERLFETGRTLVKTVAAFPVDRLTEKRPGVDGTWYELICGELQHELYHAGQIPILKKAQER